MCQEPAQYLEAYADSFGLDVRLNMPVRTIRPTGPLEIESNGTVLRPAAMLPRPLQRSDHARLARAEEFGGRLLHSHEYRFGS
jgi:hypothetical protein